MSEKIIGATVGPPTSPSKIADEIKPVKTVNNVAPDENGNVNININIEELARAVIEFVPNGDEVSY